MSRIRREIGAIALPAIISNITTPLLAMVDVAIVGHIGSAVYIAAVAIGSSIFNMLYWLFGFLRMGASGMTAQAYGAADNRLIATILHRSLAVGLLIGLLLIAISSPVCSLMLGFMDADAETIPAARSYFLIAISGAPATLGSYALSGWFIGMQDSRSPMWMSLVTNVVNIIVSLTAVFGFGMRIEGIAVGSAVAQWTGFIFGLIVALRRYRPARPDFGAIVEWSGLKRFFSVNADIFLRTLCLVAVTVWFTRSGSVQGTEILAANTLLLQLFLFFSYFMDGFAFSGEALAGKYLGQGDRSSLARLISALTRIGVVMALAFGAVYFIFGPEILSLLTDDTKVLGISNSYLLWAVAVPLAGTYAFIWDGLLIGLTRTRLMLLSMLVATAVFFSVCAVARPVMGNHGLWLAFVIYLAIRGIVERLLYRFRPT